VKNSSAFVSGLSDDIITNTFGQGANIEDCRVILNNKFTAISHIINNANYVKSLSLFFYASIFSVISATVTSCLFIMGGSSAGSDFITVLYSVKKHKDVGKIYTFINAFFLILGCIIGNYVSGIIAWYDIVKHYSNMQIHSNPFISPTYFFSSNLIFSFL